jgi:hypothetical protein
MQSETDLNVAKERYENFKQLMKESQEDPALFQKYAQLSNEAWLEYKKASTAHEQQKINKKMNELYYC